MAARVDSEPSASRLGEVLSPGSTTRAMSAPYSGTLDPDRGATRNPVRTATTLPPVEGVRRQIERGALPGALGGPRTHAASARRAPRLVPRELQEGVIRAGVPAWNVLSRWPTPLSRSRAPNRT